MSNQAGPVLLLICLCLCFQTILTFWSDTYQCSNLHQVCHTCDGGECGCVVGSYLHRNTFCVPTNICPQNYSLLFGRCVHYEEFNDPVAFIHARIKCGSYGNGIVDISDWDQNARSLLAINIPFSKTCNKVFADRGENSTLMLEKSASSVWSVMSEDDVFGVSACVICEAENKGCQTSLLIDVFETTPSAGAEQISNKTREQLKLITRPSYTYASQIVYSSTYIAKKIIATVNFVRPVYITGIVYKAIPSYRRYGFYIHYRPPGGDWTKINKMYRFDSYTYLARAGGNELHLVQEQIEPMLEVEEISIKYELIPLLESEIELQFDFYGCEMASVNTTGNLTDLRIIIPHGQANKTGYILVLCNANAYMPTMTIDFLDGSPVKYINNFETFQPFDLKMAGLSGRVSDTILKSSKGGMIWYKVDTAGIYTVSISGRDFYSNVLSSSAELLVGVAEPDTMTVSSPVTTTEAYCEPTLEILGLSNDKIHGTNLVAAHRVNLIAEVKHCPNSLIESIQWKWTAYYLDGNHATIFPSSSSSYLGSPIFHLADPSPGHNGRDYQVQVHATITSKDKSVMTIKDLGYLRIISALFYILIGYGQSPLPLDLYNPYTKASGYDHFGREVTDNHYKCVWVVGWRVVSRMLFSKLTRRGTAPMPFTAWDFNNFNTGARGGHIVLKADCVTHVTYPRLYWARSSSYEVRVESAASNYYPVVKFLCLYNCHNIYNGIMTSMHFAIAGSFPGSRWYFNEQFAVSKTLNWDTETKYGKYGRILYILPGVLQPRKSYIIGLDAANRRTVLKITTTASPRIGSCSVKPDVGYALSTEFTISCNGFTPSAHTLKYYHFYLDNSRGFLLYSSMASFTHPLLLPPGTHNIVIDVSEPNGHTATVFAIVKVTTSALKTALENSDELTLPGGLITVLIEAWNMQVALTNMRSVMMTLKSLKASAEEKHLIRVRLSNYLHATLPKISCPTFLIAYAGMIYEMFSDWDDVPASFKWSSYSLFKSVKTLFNAAKTSQFQLTYIALNEAMLHVIDSAIRLTDDPTLPDGYGNIAKSKVVADVLAYYTEEAKKVDSLVTNLQEFTFTTPHQVSFYLKALLVEFTDVYKIKLTTEDGRSDTWASLNLHMFDKLLETIGKDPLTKEEFLLVLQLNNYNLLASTLGGEHIASPICSLRFLCNGKFVDLKNLTGPASVHFSLPIKASFLQGPMVDGIHAHESRLDVVYNNMTQLVLPDQGKVLLIKVVLEENKLYEVHLDPVPAYIVLTILLKRKTSDYDIISIEEFNNQANVLTLTDDLAGKSFTKGEIKFNVTSRQQFVIEGIGTFLIGIIPANQMVNSIELERLYKAEEHISGYNAYTVAIKIYFIAGDMKCKALVSNNWNSSGCKRIPSVWPNVKCECQHVMTYGVSYELASFNFHQASMPLIKKGGPQEQESETIIRAVIILGAILYAVTVVWIIFIPLVFGLRMEDKYDQDEVGVAVIENLHETNKYVYLVCAITGCSYYSGTSANVFMSLVGRKGQTAAYLLLNSQHLRFRTGSQNWFAITTFCSLGELKYAHIWTDMLGSRPNWFLKELIVKDIDQDKTWTFICNSWMGPNYYPMESIVSLPATPGVQIMKNLGFQFQRKFSMSLNNHHLWLSIIFKPAISQFTRVQRLACALTFTCIAMFLNMKFLPSNINSIDGDLPAITIANFLPTVLYGMKMGLISTFAPVILSGIFASVKKNVEGRIKSSFEPITSSKMVLLKNKSNKKHEFALRGTVNIGLESVEVIIDYGPSDKLTSHGFPRWLCYIGWLLALGSSSYCTAMLGIWQQICTFQESMHWLLAFMTSLLTNILLFYPLLVLIISVIWTIMRRSVHYDESDIIIDLCHGDCTMRSVNIIKTVHQTQCQEYFGANRAACYLKPPSKKEQKKGKRHMLAKHHVQATVRDVILKICFISFLLLMIWQYRNVNTSYNIHRSFRDMFSRAKYAERSFPIDKVQTIADIWTYVENTFMPTLFFPAEDRTENYMTADLVAIPIGGVRLRQIRIRNDTCTDKQMISIANLNITNCERAFSLFDEETGSSPWSNSITASVTNSSMWIYKGMNELRTIPVIGQYTLYPGAGYIINIPQTKDTREQLLQTAKQNYWIDKQTRAIFLEFTIYNPIVNLFTIASLIFEFSATGVVHAVSEVTTCKLMYEYKYVIEASYGTVLLIHAMLSLYFERKSSYVIGKRAYFANIWICMEIILIIACCLTSLGMFYKIKLDNDILTEYKQNPDQFVSFFQAALVDSMVGYGLAVITFISILTLVKIFLLIEITAKLIRSLKLSKIYLKYVLLFIFVYTVASGHVGVILFGTAMYGFSNILASSMTVLNLAFDESELYALTAANVPLMLFIVCVFFMKILSMSLLLSIVIHGVRMVRQDVKRDYYNFRKYIFPDKKRG